MVAVISSDFGRAPVARVVAGMERLLRQKGYLLILSALDATSEWDRMSVELQQRGIEGVLAVGASLPREVGLPVVSVDLGYLSAGEPLAEEACAWLTELGESAVEAVLHMIETKAAPRNTKIVPKFPPAFADLSSFERSSFERSRFDLPSTGLGLQGEVRDAS